MEAKLAKTKRSIKWEWKYEDIMPKIEDKSYIIIKLTLTCHLLIWKSQIKRQ